jgi:hypothetical protein
MIKPAKCHCGSISWGRNIEESRYICASCKRPLWQPIESAPKDGTTILAYGAWPMFPTMPDVCFCHWDEDEQWWAFDGEEMLLTHWMPLPEGPGND